MPHDAHHEENLSKNLESEIGFDHQNPVSVLSHYAELEVIYDLLERTDSEGETLKKVAGALFKFYTDYYSSPTQAIFYKKKSTSSASEAPDSNEAVVKHRLYFYSMLALSSLKLRHFRLKTFIFGNWVRLLVLRTSQLTAALAALSLVALKDPLLSSCFETVFVPLLPVLAVLSFAFYVPRLAINLGLTLKHVFYPTDSLRGIEGMNKMKLLNMQLQRRRFQLLNDGVWFVDGLTVYLVITLCAAATAMPVTAFLVGLLYFFDVANAWYDLRCEKRLAEKAQAIFPNMKNFSQDYLAERIKAKEQALKFTILFAVGKIPLLVSGLIVVLGGASILSNPVSLAIFAAAALLVLGTHIWQRQAQKKPVAKAKPLAKLDSVLPSVNVLAASSSSLNSTASSALALPADTFSSRNRRSLFQSLRGCLGRGDNVGDMPGCDVATC